MKATNMFRSCLSPGYSLKSKCKESRFSLKALHWENGDWEKHCSLNVLDMIVIKASFEGRSLLEIKGDNCCTVSVFVPVYREEI